MGFIEFAEDSLADSSWSVFQIFLAASCLLPMVAFSKLPLDFYHGSGWSLITYIAFILFFAAPIIYIQFRFGARYKRGLLCILEKYSPWTICFTSATLVTNFLHLILGSVFIAYCLAYVFFTFFVCDGKYCTGATFMWGSCSDRWSEGDCKEGFPIVYNGPLAEEKFFFNFLLMKETKMLRFGGFANWFDLVGLPILPYLLGWLIVILFVVFGSRIFGFVVLIFGPISISLLTIVTVFVGIEYSNTERSLSNYTDRFYRMFPSHNPTLTFGYDLFAYQPLVWGFLSTFIHLSQITRLWNGIYPILGRWVGEGRTKRHTAWIPLLMLFALIGQLPVLLVMFSVASSFSMRYIRCYLGIDWAVPFVVLLHVFSKFSTHTAIVACFIIGFLLTQLLAQSLLLICTVENMLDHLSKWYESVERFRFRTYRILLFCICIFLLCPLGLILITRSGFYWIRLTTEYVDRLQFVLILAQSIGFIILYARSKITKRETFLVKVFMIIFILIVFLISLAVYCWYLSSANAPPPDSQCMTFSAAPPDDPLQNQYKAFGWLISIGPIIIGILIGLAVNSINSRRSSTSGVECCAYMFGGDIAVAKASKKSQNEMYQAGVKIHPGASSLDLVMRKSASEYLQMGEPQWRPITQLKPVVIETPEMTLQRMQRESAGIYCYDPRGDSDGIVHHQQDSYQPTSKTAYNQTMSLSKSQGDLYRFQDGTLRSQPFSTSQRRYSQHSNFLTESQENLMEPYNTVLQMDHHNRSLTANSKDMYRSNTRHQKTALLRKL